jgi:hypothetical protein
MSYLRFSGIAQAAGDSETRQTGDAENWVESFGKTEEGKDIQFRERFADRGLSGYYGTHVKKGDLGTFLAMTQTEAFRTLVESRDVYLVVEDLIRLSRQDILEQIEQLGKIVKAGVLLVTLADGKIYSEANVRTDVSTLIIAITHMGRGHAFSADLSVKVKKAMIRKREAVKAGKELWSKQVPRWLKVVDGKIVTIPKNVAVVRKIFSLAASGLSPAQIAFRLNKEGTRSLSKTRSLWTHQMTLNILDTKAVIGSLVFTRPAEAGEVAGRRRRIEVDEVTNYYPAVITPEEWAKTRQVIGARTTGKGRTSPKFHNLFTKVAFDRATGEPIYASSYAVKKGGITHYLPKGVRMGARKGAVWNGQQLEALFLETCSAALAVEGKLDEVEGQLALTEQKLEDTQSKIEKLIALLEGDEDDEDIGAAYAKRKAEKKALVIEADALRQKIAAGAGGGTLDPAETDRAILSQAIRANVRRIELDCDKKEFDVELMNGIRYHVGPGSNPGSYSVSSSDFAIPGGAEVQISEGKKAA